MGLFGVRRAASKDQAQSDNILSPTKASSAILANLFTDSAFDDEDSCEDVKPSVPALKQPAETAEVSARAEHVMGAMDRKKTTRGAGGLGGGSGSPRNMGEAMMRMARRDSIKRSVSRKIARSESRRQMLNIKDERNKPTDNSNKNNKSQRAEVGTTSTATSASTTTIEGKMALLSMSPVTPAVAVTDLEEDPLDMEGEHDESMAISCDPAALTMTLPPGMDAMSVGGGAVGSNGIPSRSKSRRRPPPLIGRDGPGVPDSAIDWPSGGLFGSNGGFMTGGFKITAEGMVGKPEMATRQDSDPEADGEAPPPESDVVVRSLKELRAGPTIGTGAAGRVYIAEHLPSQETLAMKVVNVYDKEKRNQLMKELETLSTHVSRYLVRFHGAFYDGSGAVHIALEYMDHGCLSTFVQRVGPIPERIVQMIASDCLRGLRFLHRHHVLHRDFKTANILLSRKNCCAKLSDFGLARDLNPGVSKVDTFVGTVAYMSPERLQGGKYTYASDIWGLGVSMVECLLGRHPFNQPQNYFDYIEATAVSSTLQAFDDKERKFSAEARDFVALCTFTDAKRRPQATELLEHGWMKGVERDNVLLGSWLDECRAISMRVASRSRKATH